MSKRKIENDELLLTALNLTVFNSDDECESPAKKAPINLAKRMACS